MKVTIGGALRVAREPWYLLVPDAFALGDEGYNLHRDTMIDVPDDHVAAMQMSAHGSPAGAITVIES